MLPTALTMMNRQTIAMALRMDERGDNFSEGNVRLLQTKTSDQKTLAKP